MRETPLRRGCLWWGLSIIGGLLLLLCVIAVVGAIYQARVSAADRVRYPPPGDLVLVNGRHMHIHCQGKGSPTVILDAGQGGWSIDWSEIMPQLNTTTQVCAYDRAGYGWSDPATDDRTPQHAADDLAALLDAAAIAGPYIVVGFSHAGLATRLYAAQHPEEVVGMVLIDPATEFDNELMDETLRQQQQATIGLFQAFGFAARLGIIRLLDPREMAPYAPFLAQNPTQPDIYYRFVAEPNWWQTSAKEFSSHLSEATLDYVHTNGPIPNLLVTIIGAEIVTEREDGGEAISAARLSRLKALAERPSQGQFILAADSSHEVPRERPDIVVVAIQQILAATRNR
jgi:pimeloyl-ACP methyl ester carboxylesterase